MVNTRRQIYGMLSAVNAPSGGVLMPAQSDLAGASHAPATAEVLAPALWAPANTLLAPGVVLPAVLEGLAACR